VLYDSIIQHGDGDDPDGLPALLKRTEKAVGGTPKRGIDEKKWLESFLKIRRQDLENPHAKDTQKVWRESVDRVMGGRAGSPSRPSKEADL
jgi:chitosanase